VTRVLLLLQALGLDRLFYRLWRYNPVALYRLYGHHAFDRRFGVRTSGYGDLRYEPTPVSAFTRTVRALEALPVALEDLTFIDIGSGKGKAVLLASTFPFHKVVGVELYGEFHTLAVENMEKFPEAVRKCRDVELVLEDAAAYELPAGGIVLYFFNPFPEAILRNVLANIERTIALRPSRPVYLIYYAPIVFRDTPWDRRLIFDRSSRLDVMHASREFSIYRGRS